MSVSMEIVAQSQWIPRLALQNLLSTDCEEHPIFLLAVLMSSLFTVCLYSTYFFLSLESEAVTLTFQGPRCFLSRTHRSLSLKIDK